MGGDLGGAPFAFLVQLGDQNRVQVLAVLPRSARLHRDSGVGQPRADHALRGVLSTGDLLQRAALVDVPAVQHFGRWGVRRGRPGRRADRAMNTEFPASFCHPPGGNTATGADLGVVEPLCHVQIGQRGAVHEQRWTVRRRSACTGMRCLRNAASTRV